MLVGTSTGQIKQDYASIGKRNIIVLLKTVSTGDIILVDQLDSGNFDDVFVDALVGQGIFFYSSLFLSLILYLFYVISFILFIYFVIFRWSLVRCGNWCKWGLCEKVLINQYWFCYNFEYSFCVSLWKVNIYIYICCFFDKY